MEKVVSNKNRNIHLEKVMRLPIVSLIYLLILGLSGSSEGLSLSITSIHMMKPQLPPIPVLNNASTVAEKWITQKLDHFDTTTTEKRFEW
jgi:hypothetical protein